jgi:glycosyltransferase involved in cell wall biosynthesis
MSLLGRLAYHLRTSLAHGLRAAWQRDIVRWRILKTAPVAGASTVCEIHVLTSKDDWLNLVWTLKSFYRASRRDYALCIHDDGTLKPEQMRELAWQFPAARIIPRAEADALVEPLLAAYPRCREFRRTNPLAPKIFDFAAFARSSRILLLDSDILFFREPAELLARIEDIDYRLNTVNGDVASAYTTTPEIARDRAGVQLIERFNSGLGLIHRDSLPLDWLEEFLGLPDIIGHFWRIEQTLFALCSSRWGVEPLPPEYAVHLAGSVAGAPCRHYVGAIRHLFYRDGIPRLVEGGILSCGPRPLRVAHLPVYSENSYQPLLMGAQKKLGLRVIDGGGGGNFLRTAMFFWQADVLHLHWLHPYLLRPSAAGSILRSTRFLVEIALLKLAGHRIIWTIHNLKNHDNHFVAIERFASRLFCTMADGAIVHCGCVARDASAAFGIPAAKMTVIPHGNFVGAYPPFAGSVTLREELSIPPDAAVFLFLGRIRPYKGVMDLVSAFGRLAAPNTHLIIAGKPNEQLTEEFEKAVRAGPAIHFIPGYVPTERVALYMDAADVVVLPYRDVLTSSALILAMSFAKAAIAPELGCVPETLDPCGGVLYRADDPHGLETAMRRMLEQREQLPEMGRRNRARADAWSWDVIAADTVKLYSPDRR